MPPLPTTPTSAANATEKQIPISKTVIATELPVWTEQIDPEYIHFKKPLEVVSSKEGYQFLESNNYPLRNAFIVDPLVFKKQENWEYWLKNKKNPRKYILSVFEKNKTEFKRFIKGL